MVHVEARPTARDTVDCGRTRTRGLMALLLRRFQPHTRGIALAVVFLAGLRLTGCTSSLRERTARLDVARAAPTAESAMFEAIMGAECQQMAIEDQERAETVKTLERNAAPRPEKPLRAPARRPPW